MKLWSTDVAVSMTLWSSDSAVSMTQWSSDSGVIMNLRSFDSVLSVPDRRRRIHPEVVLVRRWVSWVLRIWRGEGSGKGGSGEVSLQAT